MVNRPEVGFVWEFKGNAFCERKEGWGRNDPECLEESMRGKGEDTVAAGWDQHFVAASC